MFRIALTGAALALTLPALAQEMPSADPGAAAPGQSAASPDTAAGTTPQLSAVVDAEFPVYDADKSEELDRNEFSKWVMALKQQEVEASGKTMAQGELTSWAATAFRKADADGSKTVSKAEFTRYLGG